MQDSDLKSFIDLMAVISELYGKAISGHLTEIYWQALIRFEWEDIDNALRAHIHNPDVGQYFPKPADLIRWIEGSNETKALRAWAMVEKAIYQVGSYQSLVFDDPLIHAVLEDMGGWIKLCSTTLDELPFRANEFQKRYLGFLIKKPARYPKYLVGITETANATNGFEVKPPLLVGNPKKAEQVMRTGGGTPLAIQTFTEAIAAVMQLPSQTKNEDEI